MWMPGRAQAGGHGWALELGAGVPMQAPVLGPETLAPQGCAYEDPGGQRLG